MPSSCARPGCGRPARSKYCSLSCAAMHRWHADFERAAELQQLAADGRAQSAQKRMMERAIVFVRSLGDGLSKEMRVTIAKGYVKAELRGYNRGFNSGWTKRMEHGNTRRSDGRERSPESVLRDQGEPGGATTDRDAAEGSGGAEVHVVRAQAL